MLSSLLGTPHWPQRQGRHPVRRGRQRASVPRRAHACCSCSRPACSTRRRRCVLGAFSDWRKSPLDRGYTLKTRDRARCARRRKTPILTGLPFGHVPTKVTLPVGARVAAAGRRARRAHRLVSARVTASAGAARSGPTTTQRHRDHGPRMRRWLRSIAALRVAGALADALRCCAACSRGCNNSPYPTARRPSNTLFTAFDERSPRHLDPTASYWNNETPYTYQIYEPLVRLPLPEAAVRAGAEDAPTQVVKPHYLDKDGKRAARRRAGRADRRERLRRSASSRASCTQPHPAFAKDEQGALPLPRA